MAATVLPMPHSAAINVSPSGAVLITYRDLVTEWLRIDKENKSGVKIKIDLGFDVFVE